MIRYNQEPIINIALPDVIFTRVNKNTFKIEVKQGARTMNAELVDLSKGDSVSVTFDSEPLSRLFS